MDAKTDTNALTTPGERLPAGLHNAIALWANKSTRPTSARRRDLLRDKTRAVTSFFEYVQRPVQLATALDVAAWQAHLEGQGLAASTVYARCSRVSSFYRWAMDSAELGEHIHHNPVDLARPPAPRAYQNDSAKALDVQDAAELLAVTRDAAEHGVVGKRDHAILLLFFATGLRRSEVLRLRWRDVKLNGTVQLRARVKGGDYRWRAVDDTRVRDAILDYLRASGRLQGMTPDSPLWTSHDRSGLHVGHQLTGHAYAARLKKYAVLAGIGDVHIHMTRHTVARMVGEDDGVKAAQEILGHRHESTTRVYLDTIRVQKDRHSTRILDALDA